MVDGFDYCQQMTPVPTLIVVSAFLSLALAACASSAPAGDESIDPYFPETLSVASNDSALMGKWLRSCGLCHITGEAGAPVAGDTEEWQRRLQAGEQRVMNSVLYGVNSMPPLGYCMACEIADFRAMIEFMAGLEP